MTLRALGAGFVLPSRAIRAAAAFPAALLCVRTADAFFAARFSAQDIEYRSADNKRNRRDCYIINYIHNYTLRAYSALICLFLLTIATVNTATITRTIAQPKIGIQGEPKLPPVKSVPKKNTINETVYPTAN